ncbi:ABC transporter ATP-binding protein [Amycolatopsis anabasis]|uniref:ABC transporter ATP-binding protein n=1 Tax=Amycolatopsis anabasis TaxID=1840409 RepID=UPI00131EC8C8|nr:ABC transporter ATP-binding protein [Amycolatopsis anabasis]
MPVVDDVSFSVGRGEAHGLVGESGSGKTLTLRAVPGLLPHGTRLDSGRIFLDGEEVTAMSRRRLRAVRGRRVGMVFQDPMTALNPVMTVGEQIAEAPMVHFGWSRRAAGRRAIELMREVGIPEPERRARAYPHEFSGGMRQRVGIAIALSCSPGLLLCDEPTTALDVTVQEQILELLRNLRATGEVAILFVTHDLAVIAELCERVSVMYAGQIVETGATAEVFRRPRHAYTLGLLRSAPDPRAARCRLVALPGLPPDPADPPVGCRFHPRCGFSDDACRADRVYRLRRVDGHRSACVHGEAVADA